MSTWCVVPCDTKALTSLGRQLPPKPQPASKKLAIGARGGQGIHDEVARELPHGRQHLALAVGVVEYPGHDLLHELPVDRPILVPALNVFRHYLGWPATFPRLAASNGGKRA